MQIFDASIRQWREQTDEDKKWAADVIRFAFPEQFEENK